MLAWVEFKIIIPEVLEKVEALELRSVLLLFFVRFVEENLYKKVQDSYASFDIFPGINRSVIYLKALFNFHDFKDVKERGCSIIENFLNPSVLPTTFHFSDSVKQKLLKGVCVEYNGP